MQIWPRNLYEIEIENRIKQNETLHIKKINIHKNKFVVPEEESLKLLANKKDLMSRCTLAKVFKIPHIVNGETVENADNLTDFFRILLQRVYASVEHEVDIEQEIAKLTHYESIDAEYLLRCLLYGYLYLSSLIQAMFPVLLNQRSYILTPKWKGCLVNLRDLEDFSIEFTLLHTFHDQKASDEGANESEYTGKFTFKLNIEAEPVKEGLFKMFATLSIAKEKFSPQVSPQKQREILEKILSTDGSQRKNNRLSHSVSYYTKKGDSGWILEVGKELDSVKHRLISKNELLDAFLNSCREEVVRKKHKSSIEMIEEKFLRNPIFFNFFINQLTFLQKVLITIHEKGISDQSQIFQLIVEDLVKKTSSILSPRSQNRKFTILDLMDAFQKFQDPYKTILHMLVAPSIEEANEIFEMLRKFVNIDYIAGQFEGMDLDLIELKSNIPSKNFLFPITKKDKEKIFRSTPDQVIRCYVMHGHVLFKEIVVNGEKISTQSEGEFFENLFHAIYKALHKNYSIEKIREQVKVLLKFRDLHWETFLSPFFKKVRGTQRKTKKRLESNVKWDVLKKELPFAAVPWGDIQKNWEKLKASKAKYTYRKLIRIITSWFTNETIACYPILADATAGLWSSANAMLQSTFGHFFHQPFKEVYKQGVDLVLQINDEKDYLVGTTKTLEIYQRLERWGKSEAPNLSQCLASHKIQVLFINNRKSKFFFNIQAPNFLEMEQFEFINDLFRLANGFNRIKQPTLDLKLVRKSYAKKKTKRQVIPLENLTSEEAMEYLNVFSPLAESEVKEGETASREKGKEKEKIKEE